MWLSTWGGVAGARGHRRCLEDDSVAAGGEPNCHLLIQDLPGSLEYEGEGGGGVISLIIKIFHVYGKVQ